MGKKATERLTLLIVEDEPSTREGMAELLERDGYHVITAADEREALQTARLPTYETGRPQIKSDDPIRSN